MGIIGLPRLLLCLRGLLRFPTVVSASANQSSLVVHLTLHPDLLSGFRTAPKPFTIATPQIRLSRDSLLHAA